MNRESILPENELPAHLQAQNINNRNVSANGSLVSSPYSSVGVGSKFESLSISGNGNMDFNLSARGAEGKNTDTIEERTFLGALVVLEGHFGRPQIYMAKAMVEVKKMIAQTLDLSLNKADVRYVALRIPF